AQRAATRWLTRTLRVLCAPMLERSNAAPVPVNPPLPPAGGVSATLMSIVTTAPRAYASGSPLAAMDAAACIAAFHAAVPPPVDVARRQPETTPPGPTVQTMLPRVPLGMSELMTAARAADAIVPATGRSRPMFLSFLA